MKKTRWEYVKEEFCYLKDGFKDFIVDPLLGRLGEDFVGYLFILAGGIIMFIAFLPAHLIGIICAITGYYEWLDKKRDRVLFGFSD